MARLAASPGFSLYKNHLFGVEKMSTPNTEEGWFKP